jgi:hypothetical protein
MAWKTDKAEGIGGLGEIRTPDPPQGALGQLGTTKLLVPILIGPVLIGAYPDKRGDNGSLCKATGTSRCSAWRHPRLGGCFGTKFALQKSMGVKKPQTLAVDPNPAWRSPVQRELDGLFGELAAFNERIAELVQQGHRSPAMSVLKAQALSLAGQIDELRCLLVVPKR